MTKQSLTSDLQIKFEENKTKQNNEQLIEMPEKGYINEKERERKGAVRSREIKSSSA